MKESAFACFKLWLHWNRNVNLPSGMSQTQTAHEIVADSIFFILFWFTVKHCIGTTDIPVFRLIYAQLFIYFAHLP